MLCLVLSGVCSYASGVTRTVIERGEAGTPIEIKSRACHSSSEKGDAIVATVEGHTLSVVFLDDFGQVVIDVSTADGVAIDLSAIHTPNGVNFYIPNAGSYVITFTFSDGDEYYGEFEVTD